MYLVGVVVELLEITRTTNTALGLTCFVRSKLVFQKRGGCSGSAVKQGLEKSLSKLVEPVDLPWCSGVRSSIGIGSGAEVSFGSSSFRALCMGACSTAVSEGS